MADFLPPVTAKLSADVSDYQRGMATVRAETASAANDSDGHFQRMSGAASAAFSAIAGAALGVGVALAGIGAFGLKAAADMEQVHVAFEGLMGSKAVADDFLASLQAFANRTPFEFTDLADAAKQLMATGTAADQVIPTMTTLGNVASTLGVGADGINAVVRALGQMQGKGKASAEELQQISEAMPGFSAIGAIAESMGISVAEAFDLMSQGAIPADAAIQAILAGMEKFPGAAGAMEKQALTLNGVMSTMKDTLKTNLVEGLTPILPAIVEALGGAQGALGDAIAGIAGTLGGLIPPLLAVASAALPIISQILQAVGGAFASIATALAPILQSLAGPIAELAGAFAPLASAIVNLLAGAIAPVLPALVHLVSVIGTALTPVINALAPIIARVAEAFGTIITKLADSGVFDRLSSIFVRLLDALAPIGEVLLNVLVKAFDDLTPAIDPLLSIVEALLPILPAVAQQFVLILTATAPLIPVFVELLVAITPLIEMYAKFVALVSTGFTAALTGIVGLFGQLVDWLVKVTGFSDFGEKMTGAWMALKGAILDAWTAIQPALGPLRDALDAVAGAMEWLLDHAPGAWAAIQGAVESAWKVIEPALGPFRALIEGIMGATGWLLDHAPEAWALVQGAIERAWRVIEVALGPFNALMQGVLGATDWLWKNAPAAWAIVQGAIETAWRIIEPLLGPLSGLLSAIMAAMGWIKDNAGAVWDGFTSAVSGMWGVVDGPLGFLLNRLRDIASAARAAKDLLDKLPNVSLPGGPSLDEQIRNWGAGQAVQPGYTPEGASGGVIPGSIGAPFPMTAHGGEVLLNAEQQAQVLWSIANGGGGGLGSGGGSSVTVVIVRDLDEALGYVPEGARPATQSAFLAARS